MTDQPGRFRINRVAEATGIPEATLRAWERRYQVPKPARTPSGYRLYSQQDVAQVRRMRELCEKGLAPGDAAKEILENKGEGVAPAADRAEGLASRAAASQAEPTRLVEVIAPEHTNNAGVLALHRAIALMERAATVAAARGTRSAHIAVGTGSVDLLVPVGTGQLVEAIARVVATRDGSVSVDVELLSENVETRAREQVARCTFQLVSL